MLLRHGYNDLGVQAVLESTGIPKGSFYHHFRDKEDFALQVVEGYMRAVHEGLDRCLDERSRPPLERVRAFFETTAEHYRAEGYLGCLLGGLGQELSGVSDVFRRTIDGCLTAIAERLAGCLAEAVERGDLPEDTDPQRLASLLVDGWEGAALRSRLRRDPGPLADMLDFFFRAASAAPGAAQPSSGPAGTRRSRRPVARR